MKKHPKEYDHYTFVGVEEVPDFEFKGRQVMVNLYAENKPNVAPGPIWSAELLGLWNFDTGKFDKVDFKPGEISIRKPEE